MEASGFLERSRPDRSRLASEAPKSNGGTRVMSRVRASRRGESELEQLVKKRSDSRMR
jgi:hypothetical protein